MDSETEILFRHKKDITNGGKEEHIYIDDQKWKNQKFSVEDKGAFKLSLSSAKTVIVSHEGTGVSVTVNKRNDYLTFDLVTPQGASPIGGLCNGIFQILPGNSPGTLRPISVSRILIILRPLVRSA